jgi:hypothetical protein
VFTLKWVGACGGQRFRRIFGAFGLLRLHTTSSAAANCPVCLRLPPIRRCSIPTILPVWTLRLILRYRGHSAKEATLNPRARVKVSQAIQLSFLPHSTGQSLRIHDGTASTHTLAIPRCTQHRKCRECRLSCSPVADSPMAMMNVGAPRRKASGSNALHPGWLIGPRLDSVPSCARVSLFLDIISMQTPMKAA